LLSLFSFMCFKIIEGVRAMTDSLAILMNRLDFAPSDVSYIAESA
jgi:hypothetical protein